MEVSKKNLNNPKRKAQNLSKKTSEVFTVKKLLNMFWKNRDKVKKKKEEFDTIVKNKVSTKQKKEQG